MDLFKKTILLTVAAIAFSKVSYANQPSNSTPEVKQISLRESDTKLDEANERGGVKCMINPSNPDCVTSEDLDNMFRQNFLQENMDNIVDPSAEHME